MPVPPDEHSTRATDATRVTDESRGLILDDFGVGRFDRSSRRVRIAVRPAEGETVCAVEGALDASSTAQLAEALDVALSIEPGNTVLVDLTGVDWMALLDVRTVTDQARRAHRDRRIIVKYTESRHREDAALLPHDAAHESRHDVAARSVQEQSSGDLMPVSAVR